MNKVATGLISTLALVGCTPDALDESRFATGSSTTVASADYASAYAVNTDAGTMSRVSPDGQVLDAIEVGAEPTRVARVGDRLFVTLRGERRVAIVTQTATGMALDGKVDVGAEPYGIVASEDGTRAYVAASQGNRIHELDSDGDELRTWEVPNEPRYLALHPSGDTLYVATGRGEADLHAIDLTSDGDEQPIETVVIPEITRLGELDDTGEAPIVTLTPRITGDLSVSPDGRQLVVPVLYVDHITPVTDPVLGEGGDASPVSNGYGAVSEGMSRFNPGLAVVELGRGGTPDPDEVEPIFVGGNVDTDFDTQRVRSYPSSVTVSPDGVFYVVTMQGSDALAIVGRNPFLSRDRHGGAMVGVSEPMSDSSAVSSTPFTSIEQGGFSTRPKAFVSTRGAAGPDGIVFLGEDEAFVHGGFDRTMANIDFAMAASQVDRFGEDGIDGLGSTRLLNLSEPLERQVLPDDVVRGRELFFSATDDAMVAGGAGVSCASCHFEGRNDGLTWAFSSGPRQTPTLAGRVSDTEPVTWTSQVESVAHEAQITTEARMGGEGLAQQDLDAIAAFVDFTRVPDVEVRADTAAIERGKAIFERDDVACASCHGGEASTDNSHHTMFGLEAVNTPTLRGIAASAPYLHDGRAATLRDVLEFSRSGEMGDTSMLTEAEMQDLEAYLTSL